MTGGPTKDTVYDLLERIVNRVVWSTEQEKNDMLAVVNDLRQHGGFGYMATLNACTHPEDRRGERYRTHQSGPYRMMGPYCTDCGKDLT